MPTLAENRKALHDYTILKTFEAGVVLSGQEVKSAKQGQLSLKGSFVHTRAGEAFLVNAYITPYQEARFDASYNPSRDRKLLLTKKELNEIANRRESEGLTVVPLSIFTKRSLIKVRIGLARGKKKYDKRRAIKEKELKQKIQRVLNK